MIWDFDFRIRWLIRLVGIGLISGMLLSLKLWITNRLYPHFPVWDWVPQPPHPMDSIFVFLFLGCVGWMIYKPGRLNIIVVLLWMLVFALQDQSRWQPWFYQYGLMLLPFVFVKEPKQESSVFGLQQFIVITVYAWGGIHKCQAGWMSVWENSLVEPILQHVSSEGLAAMLLGIGYVIPVIEILMAVGLLFKRTRFPAIVVVLLTHLTILVLLGPVKGHISNSVVWPWNTVMMAMVVVLFIKIDKVSFSAFRIRPLTIPAYGIGLLMMITPILFYADLWDRYLSFSLYAGQQKRYLVKVPYSALERIPPEWNDYLFDSEAEDGHRILSPSVWSTKELNVPLISEWRILRSFSEVLCDYNQAEDPFIFYIDYRHLPDKAKGYFTCEKINEMGRD